MPSVWPIALAYLFTALGSLFDPTLRHEFLAGGSLIFSITALFISAASRPRPWRAAAEFAPGAPVGGEADACAAFFP